MRKTREILRQKWTLNRSHREVSASLRVSLGTITETLTRASVSGLDWATVQGLADDELERRLYGEGRPGSRPAPDCHWLHTERRRPGVTLQLLHLEYLEANPGGYQYTQFCEIYRRWLKRRRLSMRQVYRAGEKTFVDYSGKKPHYVDPSTGEMIEVELFVAVLGASNFTFAEATRTQQGQDWIASHVRAFRYFGGVTEVTVCDQLKSGVVVSCRYEPGVQRTYEELAEHYGTAIVPARPRSPRDKAKVEACVQVVQRWILARLRNETFFSLEALNERIAELLEELNDRPMRTYKASRRELFERLDRPALRPLPAERFVYGTWKAAKVSIDYHVAVSGHYYSVHYTHVGDKVDIRVSASTVEIFLGGRRIASHLRSLKRGGHTTNPEHMPVSHRKHQEWSPSRFIRWGSKIGPATARLVEAILTDRPHPEQGYRSCLGILRLEKKYGADRLEAACARAFTAGARSYRHVDSILKNGLDSMPLPDRSRPSPPIVHENIRGAQYYQ
ncbi:MAG: IS21 family transposase [Candidatus Krumholzibacteriia bacterium]